MTFSRNFSPASQIIANITRSNPGVVTTTQNHGYFSGLYVRLVLPANFGMQQVNGQVYLITVLTPTTFSINTNTSNFDAFSLTTTKQSPQVIPVGEIAATLVNAERNLRNIIPET